MTVAVIGLIAFAGFIWLMWSAGKQLKLYGKKEADKPNPAEMADSEESERRKAG